MYGRFIGKNAISIYLRFFISGVFSVNVSLGYKIEKGEIVGRVKDVMLAGNSYDALNHVAAIGDRAEWVWGSLRTPPIQIEGLSVVAK